MISRIAIAALASAVPLASVVAATPPRGISYDCDTAADHFSDLSIPAGAGAFTVSGTIRLRDAVRSKAFIPVARLTVTTAADRPGASGDAGAGFELMVVPPAAGKAPTMPMLDFVSWTNGGEAVKEMIAPPAAAEVPFVLRYDGSRLVTDVDGHAKTLPLAAPDPVVRITCSTGEFLFTDLVIAPR